jgi:NodT family efflux transporter outer membrane factor (OMF) lipoprotein
MYRDLTANGPSRFLTFGFMAVAMAWGLNGCAAWRSSPEPQPRVAAVAPVAPAKAWWLNWHDEVLNALQERLLARNPGVQIASAKVRQAQAAVQAAQASGWPTLSVQSTAGRSQTGQATANNAVSLTTPMTWELDVWGRLADVERASQARWVASQADLALARLSAQATLVQVYVQLRAAERQLKVLESTEAAQQRALALTQAREAAGVSSTQDVIQARLQWRNTQSQRLDVQSSHQQLLHALSVLLGEEPSSLNWTITGTLPRSQALPEVVSAQVLQRRPDVASAQASVRAAQASVGAAQKAFFPTLSFSANAGYRSADLANLFTSPARLWSVGGTAAVQLLDGGARRASTEAAQGVLDQAAASYRQTVLVALQELQDNLVLAHHLQQQVSLRDDALDAARRNLSLTESQYQAGTVSYLNVILAQTSALSAELAAVNDRAKLLQAHNQLLKNLMGEGL